MLARFSPFLLLLRLSLLFLQSSLFGRLRWLGLLSSAGLDQCLGDQIAQTVFAFAFVLSLRAVFICLDENLAVRCQTLTRGPPKSCTCAITQTNNINDCDTQLRPGIDLVHRLSTRT